MFSDQGTKGSQWHWWSERKLAGLGWKEAGPDHTRPCSWGRAADFMFTRNLGGGWAVTSRLGLVVLGTKGA